MSQLLARAADAAAVSAVSAASAASAASAFSVSSASHSVGSEVFAGLALLVLSLVVLLILRYYLPLRTTPAYLLVPVFFALWLPASIVLLVPIDLASRARTDDEASRGIWLPTALLRVSWRVTYWLTFALTWFILPLLAEYSDSGYREPKDRVLYSLRSNAQYHLIVFGSGIAGLVYVFWTYGASVTSLKSLVMALAYCWGLVLAIYLMGHGLVAMPRRLIRTAHPSRRLRRLQTRAPRLYEQLEEAEMDLEDLEAQIAELARRKTGSALDFHDWIDDLHDAAAASPLHARPRPALDVSAPPEARAIPHVITKKYMADLTRRFVRARHTRSRYLCEWTRLLQAHVATQAILNSAASKRLASAPPPSSASGAGLWDRLILLTPHARYLVYYRLIPAIRLLLGLVLALASVAIVWSELVKAALPAASVIRISVVHHWTGDKGQVGFAGQLIATAWILYMCAAALISITEVKVWRGRALVRRNTAHESAFWYASQVARLSIPLSYNFMTFLSAGIYKKTVFYDFMGRLIDLTPLGKWFDYLFPAFILLPVLATLFGLYGKVRRWFGFGDVDPSMDDDDDSDGHGRSYGAGSWREGRDLIEREINGTSIRQRRQEAAARAQHGTQPGSREPILVVPGARPQPQHHHDEEAGAASTTPFAVSPSSSGILAPRTLGARNGGPSSGRAAQRSYRDDNNDDNNDDDDEDDNFFQSLSHRMKNTIDNMDAPRWFQDIGQGFKKPKWMAGDSSNSNEHGTSARPSSSDSNSIRRWFGGSDGRIRL